jgi:hypothetical protein
VSGTAYPYTIGLQGKTAVGLVSSTSIGSDVAKWEYQRLTIWFWIRWTSKVGAGGGYVITKLAKQGTWGDPFHCVSIVADVSNFSFNLLKNVTPRTYIFPVVKPLTQQVTTFEWHHVALTWDGRFGILYVNGFEYCRSPDNTGAVIQYDAHGEWIIGKPPTLSGQGDFIIQDLRIANVARSADYILDVARRGRSFQLQTILF